MAEINLPLTRDNKLLTVDEIVDVNDSINPSPEQTSPAETLPETATDAKTMRPPRERRTKDNNKIELRLKALEKETKELATLLKLAGVYQLKTSLTQQPAKTNSRSRRSKAQQRE